MNRLNRSKNANALLLVALALVGLALVPRALAAPIPAPDGGYPGQNTAEGDFTLVGLGNGIYNSAFGFAALNSTSTGSYNTGIGGAALYLNILGNFNTAIGFGALNNNEASNNTATGSRALFKNQDGSENTAVGVEALFSNNHGERNTAIGFQALANGVSNLNFANTATGFSALFTNGIGQGNTATGASALLNNFSGDSNTAVGVSALLHNTSGDFNIAIGRNAGLNLTVGAHNIDIGNDGVADESNKIRIGTIGTHDGTFIAGISGTPVTGSTVLVSNSGQLGTMASSARFKEEIKPMDKASEAILALKPVTFRYKKEIDAGQTSQFGLVAEDVAKVSPDLVMRDEKGEIYTVRYEAVNAMLLNEFLKEHSKVEKLEATVAKQYKDFESALADLKGQIQKVSAQLELSKPAPQTVLNNQ